MDRNPERLGSYSAVPIKEEAGYGRWAFIPSKLVPKRGSRNWVFPVCWILFVTLESQYLLLGKLALNSNILLNITRAHLTEVKAAFVIITILWQSMAAFPINLLVTRIFSAEWHYLFNQVESGILRDDTDKVSTTGSGIMDMAAHFFTTKASWTFRVAFIISLVLRLVTGIAPAAISVSVLTAKVDLSLDVANLMIPSEETDNLFNKDIPRITSRAASIVQVEQLDHKPFGYNISQNYIVPTPNRVPHLEDGNGDGVLNITRYRTDVVHFNYTCEWTLPESLAARTISLSGVNWTVHPSDAMSFSPEMLSGVFPLIPNSPNATDSEIYPVNETPFSAYLFATSGSDNDGLQLGDNIPSIPSATFNESLFRGDIATNIKFTTGAFLVCDPHPNLTIASVQLLPDGNMEVDLNDELVSRGPANLVGNVPSNISNVIFSTGMFDATSQRTSVTQGNMYLTDIAFSLFMEDRQFTDVNGTRFVRPKSLDEINESLNAYFLSASKAFTDGFTPTLNTDDGSFLLTPTITYSTLSVPATQQLNSVLGLTGSRYIFYATIGLVALVAILTPFLYTGWKQEKDYPFTIDSLSKEGLIRKQL